MNENNNICRAHSGFETAIENLKEQTKAQWEEISSMKKWLIATLTSSVFSLLGIVVMLILRLNGG